MKVEKLIAELKKLPKETEIYVNEENYGGGSMLVKMKNIESIENFGYEKSYVLTEGRYN